MSYLISNNKLLEYDFQFENFYLKIDNAIDTTFYLTNKELLVVEGFLFDLTLKKKLSVVEILEVVQKTRKLRVPIPENITGQYNIVFIKDEQIDLINDFIGMKPMYYYFDTKIVITNNLYLFLDFGFELDKIGVFQSMIPGLYIPLNDRTLIEGVKQLRCGEYILHNIITKLSDTIIDSIDFENKKIDDNSVYNIIEMLQNNASIYKNIFDKIVLPISAGVDTRITLSSFVNINDKFNFVSYGEPDYIDNRIAEKMANFIGVSHENISFKDNLFPTVDEFNNLIKYGGEYFTSCWFSVIRSLKKEKKYEDSVVLLGDVLDTLRAKNIKSVRGRSNRIRYQLKGILGYKDKLQPLEIDIFKQNQIGIYSFKIDELSQSNPKLFEKLGYIKKEFLYETEKDIDSFLKFIIKKSNPKNQSNLEEMFYVLTWGAKTMSKQINIFKGSFPSYVLMSTRNVVKDILNYCPLDRFEDKLTHKMLLQKGFNNYSHFPTSQIPFIGYNSNIYLKYMFWAFRSKVDQFLIKAGKGRLVKHIEWAKYYKNANNKELLEKLLEDVDYDSKKLPLAIFNKRASGELWPLAEVDINLYSFLMKLNHYKNT